MNFIQRVIFLTECSLLLSVQVLTGQSLTHDDSVAVDIALSKAHQFLRSKEFDSAYSYYNQASIKLRENKAWKKYYDVQTYLSRLHQRNGDIASSIKHIKIAYDEMVEIRDDLSHRNEYLIFFDINFRLGYYYSFQGNTSMSVGAFKKNIQLTKDFVGIPDTTGNLSRTYQNVATAYVESNEIHTAVPYYDSAIMVLRKTFDIRTELEAVIYLNKARLMRDFGYWEEAFENLEYAREVYQILDREGISDRDRGVTPYQRGYFYLSNALFYNTRNAGFADNITARAYADSAYQYFSQASDMIAYYPYLEYVYGESYMNDGEYDEAIEHYHKAIALNEQIHGPDFGELGYCYTYLGLIYQAMENLDSADYYFNKSIDTYQKNDWEAKDEKAESFVNLANFQLELGKYELALETIHKGLKVFVPTVKDDVLSNPDTDKVYPNKILSEIFKTKAKICKAIIKDTFQEKYALCVLDSYDKIINYSNTPLNSRVSAKSKSRYFENKYTVFEGGLITALTLYQETKNNDYLIRAFNYSEKSKATSLREKIARSNRVDWQIPKEWQEQQQTLNMRLVENKKKYAAAEEKDEDLSLEIFTIKEELVKLQNKIMNNYPHYFNIHINSGLVLTDLKQMLPDNSVLIEYFVGKDSLYVFTISDQIKAFTLDKGYLAEIEVLLTNIKNQKFNRKQANDLYKGILGVLIKDQNYDQLIIIPDRQIGLLPFETLTNMTEEGKYDYLIKQYTIDYYPSASLLINQRQKESDLKSMLAVSPQFTFTSNTLLATRSASDSISLTQLTQLPYASEEVELITNIYGGTKLIGAMATESNFKRELINADIIHLATHAVLDDRDPLYSKLVLAKDDDEDGLLHAYELYGMDIKASLVSLSACNTGFGEYYGGEGIMSLARGFMQAGVPNVLMSLWAVPDKSTSEVMSSFYNHLKSGKNKSQALRQAKIDYINKSDQITAEPYFWAGFVLMTQPEKNSGSSNIFWILGAVISLVLIGVTIKKVRSKRS